MTDQPTPAPPRKRGNRQNWLAFWLAVFGTVIFLVFMLPEIFFFVQPGESAVVWYRFWGGTDVDTAYGEGTHVIFPWDKYFIYEARLQEASQDFSVLSTDGLEVQVAATVRYRPIPEKLGILHANVGPEYLQRVLLPEVASHLRTVMGRYDPEQLYSTRREAIQDEILTEIREENQISVTGGAPLQELIYVEDVLIRSITLPGPVKAAIEQKLAQRHLMLEYDYRLQREEKERDRKRIEAEGIRQFQDIVSEGISERYLKWKGIDATLELAKSPNTKTVIIGGGKDGLPLILGPLEPSAEPARPAPVPPKPPQ